MKDFSVCIVSTVSDKNSRLNLKELKILTLIAEGKTNKQIAEDLQISPHTAKSYITVILHKMNVKYRVQAVMLAIYLKLIEII